MNNSSRLLLSRSLSVLLFACASCNTSADHPRASRDEADPQVPVVDVVKVVSQTLKTTVHLPSELVPYETVDVYPKVTGYVKWIKVDRGSRVKAGELMAELEAPELVSQEGEAEAKLQSAQSQF